MTAVTAPADQIAVGVMSADHVAGDIPSIVAPDEGQKRTVRMAFVILSLYLSLFCRLSMTPQMVPLPP